MSNLGSIHTYRSEVDRIQRFSGSTRETTVRRAVCNLINAYVACEHPEATLLHRCD